MARDDDHSMIDWRARAKPVSRQIAEIIRKRIDEGVYPVGQPLPKQASFIASFEVSATVVRRAMALLKNAGMIEVAQGHRPIVLRRSKEPRGLESPQARIYVLSGIDDALDALVHATEKLRALRARYLTDGPTMMDASPTTIEEA